MRTAEASPISPPKNPNTAPAGAGCPDTRRTAPISYFLGTGTSDVTPQRTPVTPSVLW